MEADWFREEAEKLSPTLYRVAFSILKSSFDAQDAVQEALLKAWAARERCREETFAPYLTRILINECRNIQRHRMRQTPVENLPNEPAQQEETDIDLKNAVQGLPELLRLPLLLKYMEGCSDSMIAKSLGISQIGVRTRLYRARKALKDALQPERGTD